MRYKAISYTYYTHTRSYKMGNRYTQYTYIIKVPRRLWKYYRKETDITLVLRYIVEMQIFFSFLQKIICSSYYFCILCSPHRAFPLAKTSGTFRIQFCATTDDLDSESNEGYVYTHIDLTMMLFFQQLFYTFLNSDPPKTVTFLHPQIITPFLILCFFELKIHTKYRFPSRVQTP